MSQGEQGHGHRPACRGWGRTCAWQACPRGPGKFPALAGRASGLRDVSPLFAELAVAGMRWQEGAGV